MPKVADKIVYAARDYEAQPVVIGLPLKMDGSEGPRAEKTRKLAGILHNILPLPIELWDERSSTVSAANILSNNGTCDAKHNEVLDAVAATAILESYMAFRANQQKKQN